MSNSTLFSIVTVSYNSEKTIRNTIESVLNQSYDNIEYIIIDGKSSDKTVDIIKEYDEKFKQKNYKYKWISENDNGIYDAMNKGISMATGEIIGIINSDDTYNEHAVQDIYDESIKYPEYDVYHGLLKYLNKDKVVMIRASNSDILEKNMIEHPACFVRKDLYDKYGLFNCKYKFVADYELLLRLKRNGAKFKLVESIISNFDENGSGNSFKSRYELLKLKKDYKMIGHVEGIYRVFKLYAREIKDRIN